MTPLQTIGIKEFVLNFKYAFRPQKPILFFRLVKTILNSYIFKSPPLRYVDFSLDFECNLRCKHCFASVLKKSNSPKMNISDYSRVAKECMNLGTVNFSFQGGEPLMVTNLSQIIKAFEPPKNVISVTTNGTLINDQSLKNLKETGVDILTISLDSLIPEEHDEFRGVKGTFDKTLAGIKLALKEGFRVTLGCVVTHKSIRTKGFFDLILFARKMKILLYFILPVRAGRWKDNPNFNLTFEEVSYLESLTAKSPYLRTDFQANLGGYGCGAGKEILYVTPYGDVLACPFLHISFGNIFHESINKIRNRIIKIPYFSNYNKKCLASTDKDFFEKFLQKANSTSDPPLSWKDVFFCTDSGDNFE